MTKKQVVPGVRTKFRTRDGYATATIWIDDEARLEFATLDLTLIDEPGDPLYQAWVDLMGKIAIRMMSRQTGMRLIPQRRKANYTGEEK